MPLTEEQLQEMYDDVKMLKEEKWNSRGFFKASSMWIGFIGVALGAIGIGYVWLKIPAYADEHMKNRLFGYLNGKEVDNVKEASEIILTDKDGNATVITPGSITMKKTVNGETVGKIELTFNANNNSSIKLNESEDRTRIMLSSTKDGDAQVEVTRSKSDKIPDNSNLKNSQRLLIDANGKPNSIVK